ncbi:MAG: ABC transporter ATP-binding protein [Verrucomicrobiota bacterium]
MNASVDLQNVCKSFIIGDQITPVLKGVDLQIGRGETFFVVGPSGCGKTTLISIICGTLRAEEGEIQVLEHDLRRMKDKRITQFRADMVGFVFQQFNLIPTLTVGENVSIPLKLQGASTRVSNRAAAEILEKVGLGERVDEKPSRLSGGQQQRVAIARALVHDPALVVCDEPTSALDSQTGSQVMDLLIPKDRNTDRTVIVVTHDHRIYDRADRIAEMEDGVIRRTLSQSESASAFGYTKPVTTNQT